MISIKKLSIENFKGIRSEVKIDFSEKEAKVNVLSGPNGFGKTTVFEVIEVCLTGEFNRVIDFDYVQKKNRDRKKPFFQNQTDKDVVLKLVAEDKEIHKSYLIIKHYDAKSSPNKVKQGFKNIPIDSSNFFKTYLTEDLSFFNKNDFSSLKDISQELIDELVHGKDKKISCHDTYYLFNYIQQDNSSYFLKKNEDEKGNSLSFLFNIEKEEHDRNILNDLCENLEVKYTTLKSKIDQIKKPLSDTFSDTYIQLFPDKDLEFDRENPFESMDNIPERLDQFTEELNSLIDFRKIFNPNEYSKYIQYNRLNGQIINDTEFLEVLVLKKIFSLELLKKIESLKNKIDKTNLFLARKDKTNIEKDFFYWYIPIEPDAEYEKYNQLNRAIGEIDKDLGEIGKIISELILSREQSIHEFGQLRKKEILSSNNCPLCDTPFKSYDALLNEISKKTIRLKSYNESKLEKKRELLLEINNISGKVEKEALRFLEGNKPIDNSILSKLRSLPNYEIRMKEAISTYPEIDSQDTKEFFFTFLPTDIEELRQKATNMRNHLISAFLPNYKYDEQQIPKKDLYSRYFDANTSVFESTTVEVIEKKLDYVRYKYKIATDKVIQSLNERLNKLDQIRSTANKILKKVSKTINDHKKEMIERIKIPFYIYSGKILQSYQQGLGIFINIKPTDQKNRVWLLTGHESDHDVVYHLSSGQMAVVSIAFCLSLNKVYNTSKNFKFLAIDDPIQTLDDLNVHTFIELLRNDFQDYQIILSTHDDFSARYIKYKFDKFDFVTNIKNIQDLVLQQTLS